MNNNELSGGDAVLLVQSLRARVAELEAQMAGRKQAVPSGYVMVPVEVVRFLRGEGELEGMWFGDSPPRRPHWWRKYLSGLAAAPQPSPAPAAPDVDGLVEFAVRSWHEQVANRPLGNVYRRTLDSVWRQVIRFAGEDDVVLIGPRHDDMLDESGNQLPQYATHQRKEG